MSNVITFSGWGQNYDALANIAPDAKHIDYSNFSSAEEFLASLKGMSCDILIGWSLGGQLALRAVNAGILSPKLIVLLGTAFQFIGSNSLRCGLDANTLNAFEMDFAKQPEQKLKQFYLLVAKNDSKDKEILNTLKNNKTDNAIKWLPWLDELRNFSCSQLSLVKMPKTLSIHGRDDTVVDVTQAGIFYPFIKDYHSVIFEKCGHAPHLHDPERVRQLIQEAA